MAIEDVVDGDRIDLDGRSAEVEDRDPILAALAAAQPNDEPGRFGHDRGDIASVVVLAAAAARHLLEMSDQLIDPAHNTRARTSRASVLASFMHPSSSRNGGVTMTSVALLVLRLVTGGLLIGHGAQKLFGAFGGKGPVRTAESFEKMGLEPGREWTEVAGASEMAGGALNALGFLSPIGPIVSTAPMIVAWRKVHGDKPIWSSQGGGELPATNLAIVTALFLAGPGALSFDRLLGIRAPWWLSVLALVGTAAGVAVALGDEIHTAAEAIRRDEERAAAPAPQPAGARA